MKSRTNRLLLLLCVFIGSVHNVKAQTSTPSDFSYALGGGAMYYNGDLSDDSYIPPLEVIRGFGSADVSILLIDRIDLSLRYMHGNVEGDDALSEDRTRQARNQSFYSKIDEVSLLLRARLFSVRKQRVINPYAMFGLGYFWFNPKADLDGKSYELQPLGTEGQGSPQYPDRKQYSSMALSIPFGAGIKYSLNERMNVSIELLHRYTNTDYMDDVSKTYPGASVFPPNADNSPSQAFLLSDRSYETGEPIGIAGRQRGNSQQKDQFITAMIHLTFNLQSYKCPTAD